MTTQPPVPPTPPGPTTLIEMLQWRAARQPDDTAYTFLLDGETEVTWVSYGELHRKARAIAAALASASGTHDASPNVLLLLPPGLEFIAAFFGCLYAGKTAVPVYPPRPNRTLSRLQSIVDDSRATIALATEQVLSNLAQKFAHAPQLEGLRWVAADAVGSRAEGLWEPPPVGAETLAFLQYTSGSTATPKGVMVTHGNLLHNLREQEVVARCRGARHYVSWLPPYHDMGLISGVLLPLFSGSPATLMSPVDFLMRPFRWLQAVSRVRGTVTGGPNFAYELCVQKVRPEQCGALDLSCWEMAFNGAEPVRKETLDRFASTFKAAGFERRAFYPCYGLAEATLFVTGGEPGRGATVQGVSSSALEQNRFVPAGETAEGARQLVGCGRALPGHSVLIVDPESAARCAPGEVGEIWVSGPSVARGYWRRGEATAEAFHARLSDTGEGPYLRTGDLGFVSGEELFVTGRLKDLIIIAGRNLYPQDIELTAERSHPALRPGCGVAFSVDVNDVEQLVVVQEVERRHRLQDQSEIISAVRRAVSEEHQVPVYRVALLNPGGVPKTSSGKLKRRECRALFLAGRLDLCPAQAAQSQTPAAVFGHTPGGERTAEKGTL